MEQGSVVLTWVLVLSLLVHGQLLVGRRLEVARAALVRLPLVVRVLDDDEGCKSSFSGGRKTPKKCHTIENKKQPVPY